MRTGGRGSGQAGRQATHIHKRGANLHTYIHTHREDREDREGEEDGWSATFSPPSLRLCFCCLLSLYFLQGGPLDRRRQRYLFCKPAKDTYTLAYKQRERQTERRKKPFTRTLLFGLVGTNSLLVMMMMLDPLSFSSPPPPSFPVHPTSHPILSYPIPSVNFITKRGTCKLVSFLPSESSGVVF